MLQIFIGYLFLFFNFEINGLDLLPSFVGYIFIFVGLGKLKNESSYFSKSRPWAIVMTAFEVISFAKLIIQTELSVLLFTILGYASAAVSIYIMFCIVKGIGDIEKTYCVAMEYEKIMLVWKIASALRIAIAMLTFLPTELGSIISIGIACIGFIVHIIFIVYINRVRKAYENLPMNPWNDGFPTDGNI